MKIFSIESPFTIKDQVLIPKKEFKEHEMFPEIKLNFTCKNCNSQNHIEIKPYKTGYPLDNLLQKGFIKKEQLLKNGVAKASASFQRHLGELTVFNLPGLYLSFQCPSCQESYLLSFGCGESQPGRTLCYISGIWVIELSNVNIESKLQELFGYVVTKQLENAEKLLDNHREIINGLVNGGKTGLIEAIISNNQEMVELFLTKGADPNIKSKDEQGYPLHYAVQNHQFEVVKLLLEHGAEVNAQDNFGKNPLMIAIFKRKKGREIIDLLLKHGANKTLENYSGNSADTLAKRFKFHL